jgi:hypothetical protein
VRGLGEEEEGREDRGPKRGIGEGEEEEEQSGGEEEGEDEREEEEEREGRRGLTILPFLPIRVALYPVVVPSELLGTGVRGEGGRRRGGKRRGRRGGKGGKREMGLPSFHSFP